MPALQTLCSNPLDLSLSTPQNIWTTRTLPIGNAIITGAVLRDTDGLALNSTCIVNISVQGNSYPVMFVIDGVSSAGPRYCYAAAMTSVSTMATLTPNPTAQATVLTGYTSTSQFVTIDLIGYYI